MYDINHFLTLSQVQKVFKLKTAKLICEQVITPNIEIINEKLGQKNNPMFLSYACEHFINEQARKKKTKELPI